METKIRKRVLTVIGGLLIAALTIQMATAAARNARKAARAPVVAQHFRHAFGSVDWTSTAQSGYSNYNKRNGLSAPAAVDNKSCDRLWCYEN